MSEPSPSERYASVSELATVPEMEPPFVRSPGREVPDWLEDVLPGS